MKKVILLLTGLCFSAIAHSQSNMDAAFDELDLETGGCQVQLKKRNDLIGLMKAYIDKQEQKVAQLEKQNTQLTTKVSQCKSSGEVEAKYEYVKGKYAQVVNQNDQLQAQNQQLKGQVAALQAALQQAQRSSQVAVATTPITPSQTSSASLNVSKLNIATVNATSGYYQSHAVDGKISSTWRSKGIEAEIFDITLTKRALVSRVHLLISKNRYGQPPKSIKLVFDNGSSQTIYLEDKWGWQRIAITPVLTKKISLEFGEQYNSRGENTAISINEIEVYGQK